MKTLTKMKKGESGLDSKMYGFICVSFILLVGVTVVIIREPKISIREHLFKLPIFSTLIKERNKTYLRAKMTELNLKKPAPEYLIKFVFGVDRQSPGSLSDYIKFYELISKYFPDTAEAYGMIGYCYFYLGEYQKAEEFFIQANKLMSDHFWFVFNLVMVNLKMNNIEEAKFYLQAVNQWHDDNFEKTLKDISTSMIYQDLLSKVDGASLNYLRNNLVQGYHTIDQIKKYDFQRLSQFVKQNDIQLRLF